jgi:hypothetical protein
MSVVPLKTVYLILYDGVIVKKVTNSSFSSFEFQLQFFEGTLIAVML